MEVIGGHGRSVRVLERSVGGQRGVMGGHREIVEGQWEAIAIKCTLHIANRAIISKTSGTDAVFAEKTIPRMRFHQVLTQWTCFPCMFDMSTMLKLC